MLQDNEALREEVASLRAAVAPQADVDAHDKNVYYDQDDLDMQDVEPLVSDGADNLGESAQAAMNDQHSQVSEIVE